MDEERSLFAGVAGVGLLKLASSALAVALTIVLARLLGPVEFGSYSFAFSLATLLALPLLQGLPTLAVREAGRAAQHERAAVSHALLRYANRLTIGVGIAFAAAGLYLMLGAAGYVPMPEGNSPNAPAFIGFCAGAAFLFAGLTCMVRARAGMLNIESDVPDGAPRWPEASYRMLAIGVAGAVAIVGTYAAIGSGPRAFSLSGPLVGMQAAGELLGRTVFALGAVIVLITVAALTVGTVRKLFDRRG